MIERIQSHPAIRNWSALPQLALHQAGWWACVLWMGWIGPSIMLAFLLIHLWVMRQQWKGELWLIVLSTLLGIVLDNVLAMTGCVVYVGTILVGQSPLWLVAIWAGFGATLRHCQSVLVKSMPIAIGTGFVGGPLAYLGGEKLERMTVHGVEGWSAVAVLWGATMLTLLWASRQQTVANS